MVSLDFSTPPSGVRSHFLGTGIEKKGVGLDLTKYLKFDEDELREDSPRVRMAHVLLNPEVARFFARPFRVGKGKALVYGHPLVMAVHSNVIAALTKDILSIASSDIGIAPMQTLSDENATAFVHVWLTLNGIIEAGKSLFAYTLKDILFIVEWMNYFDIELKSDMHRMFSDNFSERLKAIIDENDRRTFVKGGQATKLVLDAIEKALLEKMYDSLSKQCLLGTSEDELACSQIEHVARALGVELPPEVEIATRPAWDLARDINAKRLSGVALTPAEEKLATRRLLQMFENWQMKGQQAEDLEVQALHLGIDIPTDVAEIRMEEEPTILGSRALGEDIMIPISGVDPLVQKYFVRRSAATENAEKSGALVPATGIPENKDWLMPMYPLKSNVVDVIAKLTAPVAYIESKSSFPYVETVPTYGESASGALSPYMAPTPYTGAEPYLGRMMGTFGALQRYSPPAPGAYPSPPGATPEEYHP